MNARGRRALLINARGGTRWTEILSLYGRGDSASVDIEAGEKVTVELDEMQHPGLDFADETFDCIVCPLGLSFLHRAHSALAEWWRLTKPGGHVAASAFSGSALRPLFDVYTDQLFEYGLTPGAGAAILPWRRFSGPEALGSLVRGAGFTDVDVVVQQLGSYLPDAETWWDILSGTGLLLPVRTLPKRDLEMFKADHLHEVAMRATAGGIWFDLPVASVLARK